MSFRKIIKYSTFSLIPLLILFLSLEVTQRIRYSIKQNNRAWLFYGFKNKSEKLSGTYIKIFKNDSLDMLIIRTFAELQLPYDITSNNYKYIVCIGGSSTVGVFNEPHYKYPYLLNQLINNSVSNSNHIKYIIINMGMSSASLDDHYEPLKKILEKISPKLIIFYCGYNDIFIKNVNKIYATFSVKFGSFYNFLERYSLLLMTSKEKYIIYTLNRRKSYTEEELGRYKKLESEFYKNIDKYVNLLTKQNIKVILIPEVLMAKDFGTITTNYEDYAKKYKNISVILKEIAEKYNCEFISLQSYFDNDDFKKYFIDPVHLTNEGNTILSILIFKNSKIIRELINLPVPKVKEQVKK